MSVVEKTRVLADACFGDVGQAFADGYLAYEVILYPIGRGDRPPQRCPFYAVSDAAAKDHCAMIYEGLRYRLYSLSLLSMSGKTDGS